MTKLVSIIIPAKDEPLLQELINDTHQTLLGTPHEVIVVDKSKTPPQLEDATILRQRSNGLGKAVLEALPKASGDLIVIMDGDYSHDPKELPTLIKSSLGYDIVLGSRFIQGGRNEDSSSRNTVSKIYRLLSMRILHLQLTDPMSGFCAARREAFNAVKLNPLGYKINLELIYKAARKRYTFTEVPITFHPRRAGRSKTGVGEGLRTLIFIFALRTGLR